MPMSQISIPNRPFATDLITGLMLPDGIFVTMLGRQNITVHLVNQGASAFGASSVYIESVSNPGIIVTPNTHFIGSLDGGSATVLAWTADFQDCPPGNHYVSIIVENAANRTRIIKKIFVLGVNFDETDGTFVAEMPEGIMRTRFGKFTQPRQDCCCSKGTVPSKELEGTREDNTNFDKDQKRRIRRRKRSSIHDLPELFQRHEREFLFCPPGYLPVAVNYEWKPTPPYSGQYGDLPFMDPWWKIVLAVIAFLLLVAASIAEAVDGSGEVVAEVESPPSSSGPVPDCCGVEAEGGGTSYVAAGLLAAAATVATIAGASDERDAFRRGQDATPPAAGETTLREIFEMELRYLESVALGRPFSIGALWKYTRITDGATYSHSAEDVNKNIHVATSYKVTAPEFAVRDNSDLFWIVKAEFSDAKGNLFKGADLFVQCILVGPNGEWHRFYLQDDGNFPDQAANDGLYCGTFNFRSVKADKGLWTYYVIAQDVNDADPNLTPEEAAQIIGGMVITHQLTISFTEDVCKFVPDGHVMVV